VITSTVALSWVERISVCWSSWTACCVVRGLVGVVRSATRTWSPAVDQEQKRGWSWHGGPSRAIWMPKGKDTALEVYATGSNDSKSAIGYRQAGDDAVTINQGSLSGTTEYRYICRPGRRWQKISASSSRATWPSALSADAACRNHPANLNMLW
jgi:hypothetical protein